MRYFEKRILQPLPRNTGIKNIAREQICVRFGLNIIHFGAFFTRISFENFWQEKIFQKPIFLAEPAKWIHEKNEHSE